MNIHKKTSLSLLLALAILSPTNSLTVNLPDPDQMNFDIDDQTGALYELLPKKSTPKTPSLTFDQQLQQAEKDAQKEMSNQQSNVIKNIESARIKAEQTKREHQTAQQQEEESAQRLQNLNELITQFKVIRDQRNAKILEALQTECNIFSAQKQIEREQRKKTGYLFSGVLVTATTIGLVTYKVATKAAESSYDYFFIPLAFATGVIYTCFENAHECQINTLEEAAKIEELTAQSAAAQDKIRTLNQEVTERQEAIDALCNKNIKS